MKTCTTVCIENVDSSYESRSERISKKGTLEERIVEFFSSYPTLTKHWLHPKM